MVGHHHRFNGHEFEQTLGDSEGQGSLACCSLWGCKELDMTETEQQNNKRVNPKSAHFNEKNFFSYLVLCLYGIIVLV